MHENAIELRNVTKRFGEVTANDHVSLTLRRGEILSILGENGSGKTTLMNMLSGIYFPDEGEIFVNGRKVTIRSPHDAFELGIGMIHQHFKLISILTAAQNIILGQKGPAKLDMRQITGDINALTSRYGFDLDPNKKIYDMSVSEKQTVEIVKVIYRGADILILDEPTAVLTPQEIEKLFYVLRRMREDGKSVIIITHKLNEVMEISDRVAVLRKGQYIGTVETKDTTEEKLTEMMVGEHITLDIQRADPASTHRCLEMRGVTVRNREGFKVLDDISFIARTGEILGIAGISGSGQKELLESIAGLQHVESGQILYDAPSGAVEELTQKTPKQIYDMRIRLSFVPEDRLGMGLVGSMDLTGNMMVRSYKQGRGFFADRKQPEKLATEIVDKLEVATPSVHTPVRNLSGGNVQKVLVGREIASAPRVLMVAYPVRGLDINSAFAIYRLLNQQKEQGAAVLCVGEDLDVLIQLCDRILVLSEGRVAGIVDARTTTKEELGYMMTSGHVAAGRVVNSAQAGQAASGSSPSDEAQSESGKEAR
ncbi:simple sugar transport system ATP-binding protein [Lachnospiraceae bacterium NK3A20]|nr:simple sugar transport system ATP-binding protein [Lachnospiraceae bacterium NK3A20]